MDQLVNTEPTGVEAPRGEVKNAWRRTLLVWAAVALIASAMMHRSLIAMVDVWWNASTFQHILLVPFIIGWLVWDRRDLVAQVRPNIYPPALLLMLGAAFLWLLGRVADVAFVQQFAWVFLIQASVLTLMGWAATRALLFPLFYMLFLVPFGEFLIPPLQHFTAQFIVVGLNLAGVPVYLDNVVLETPSGLFEVAKACSGVRFLIATIALGALFANISFKSWRRRICVLLLAVIVPVIANGLRAFGTVYVAYLTDNEYAVGVDHIIYGWGFFAFVTILLLMIGMTFSDKAPTEPAFNLDAVLNSQRPPRAHKAWLWTVAAALAIAVAAPGYSLYIYGRTPARQAAALDDLQVGNGWRVYEGALPVEWKPQFPHADTERFMHFVKDGRIVSVYAAVYNNQDDARELVSFENEVVFPDYWSWLSGGVHETRFKDGAPVKMQTQKIRAYGDQVRDLWQVYWVDDRLMAADSMAKLLGAKAKLLSGPLVSGTLVISVTRSDQAKPATEVLEDFAAAMPSPLSYFRAQLRPVGKG